MTCLLVRHGHVEGIDPPRFRGRADLPLTPLGHRQAEALRDRIAREWSPEAIYASPLRRCVHTGATVGQPASLVPGLAPELLDLDYGQWQGLTHAEVRAKWPKDWDRWQQTPQLAEFPGGETLAGLVKRVTNALHAILNAHRGQTVAIVAHDSVNRVLLLHALDLPLSRYRTLAQAPCGLNVLQFDGGRFKVVTVNETGHLLGC